MPMYPPKVDADADCRNETSRADKSDRLVCSQGVNRYQLAAKLGILSAPAIKILSLKFHPELLRSRTKHSRAIKIAQSVRCGDYAN